MKELKGKVAAVTGAASGLGRAMALAFADEGMHVALGDVSDTSDVFAAVEAKGVSAISMKLDVSKAQEVEAFAELIDKDLGGAHVVCNNAGVSPLGAAWETSLGDWQWILGVNLWGVIHGIESFVPRMITQGVQGHIVNTASMAGLIASQGLGIYNTTKYAVVGLSETLQKDLRPYNIGVSVLCPMGVATAIRDSERNRPAHLQNLERQRAAESEITLIGRTLTAEHVAERVLAAILANRLYIITHEEGLEPLRRRFQRMERAIEESR